jgi:hypothetical protein
MNQYKIKRVRVEKSYTINKIERVMVNLYNFIFIFQYNMNLTRDIMEDNLRYEWRTQYKPDTKLKVMIEGFDSFN